MTRAGMAVHLPLVRARTDTTFEELYRAYVGDIYRYALAITGNTADAEDVTQTTFMNAYRAYAGGEQPLKPKNWLLTIAHNVCRQRARLASHRPSQVEYDETIGASDVPPDTVPSAGDIRRALAHLPYAQRATLIMRELEGRSHAEIAAVLGVTTHATEMLAFRARRALREHLAGSLTCTQAADALDRGDGTPGPDEEALLRAHLRECDECERAARMLRAQRTAWRALAVVPLPSSLHAFGGGGTAAAVAGTGVAAKVIVVSLAAVTVAGGAYVSKHAIGAAHHPRAITRTQHRPAATQRRRPVATATAPPHVRLIAPGTRRPTHASASSTQTPSAALAPQPRTDASTSPSTTTVAAPAARRVHPLHPAHPPAPPHPLHPAAPQTNNGVRRQPQGIQPGRPVKAP